MRPIRTVALTLGSALVASTLLFAPPAQASAISGVIGGVTYTADDGDVAAGATATAFDESTTTMVVPASVNIDGTDYDVTAVGDEAFFDTGITSLTLGANLISIGEAAFASNDLGPLVIPDSVTAIGGFAFQDAGITGLALGSELTEIGESAFMSTVNPEFPNVLQSVVIPEMVTTIGPRAFFRGGVTSLTLGTGVESIGDAALRDNDLGDVDIPNSVTTLNQFAFHNAGITDLTLGTGLSDIPWSAFSGNDLGALSIPDNITSIGLSAFFDSGITGVTFGTTPASSLLTEVANGAFADNYDVEAGAGLGDVVLPDALESVGVNEAIGDGAFSNAGVTSIEFGPNVQVIGRLAFAGNSTAEVAFPDSLVIIGQQAFNSSHVESVTFGENLESVGISAFRGNSLDELTLPSSLSSIGSGAFSANAGLLSVHFEGAAPTSVFEADDGSNESFDSSSDPRITYLRQFDATERDGGFTRPTWEGYRSATDKIQPSYMRLKRPPKVKEKKKFTITVPVRDNGHRIEGGQVRFVFKGKPGKPQFKNVTNGLAKATFRSPRVGKTTRFDVVVTYMPGDAPYKRKKISRKIKVINN